MSLVTTSKLFAIVVSLGFAGCGGTAFTADDSNSTGGHDAGGTPGMDASVGPSDGATQSPDSGSPFDSGALDAASPDGGFIPCPAAQPTAQTGCAPEGRQCEYSMSSVFSPVPTCDTVATCTNGKWQVAPPDSSGNACRSNLDSKCPATYPGDRSGLCAEPDLVCDYLRGRCECVPMGTVGVLSIDAAASGTWRCQAPGANCPATRPPLGSTCTTEGTDCDYGSCVVQGGTMEVCQGGVWQSEAVACGASTSP
jgi:hypothetical protein